MPEFIQFGFYICMSNREYSKAVGNYVVSFSNRHKSRNVQYDWACTCKAYEFKPGYCKHILSVRGSGDRCGWDGSDSDMNLKVTVDGDKVCPRCRGPVSFEYHGV